MQPHTRRTAARRHALPWGIGIALLSSAALAQYEIPNAAIAGGGGTSEAGPYRLIGTVGDASQGSVQAEAFRLTSGFPATIGVPPPRETPIFSDGFEEQTQGTAP